MIVEVPAGTSTGTMCYDADFEPYGAEHAYTNSCAQNYKFTGKERDSESGLDNFGARYYASAMGRFMTPDWAAKPVTVPYATFGDPQTLNLYTYVENSPVNRIDADGHFGGCSEISCASFVGEGRLHAFLDDGGMNDAPTKVVELMTESMLTAIGDQWEAWAMASGNAGAAQNNSADKPAPTNPDGSPKSPNGDVPNPPNGKPPGWKPGDPLVPNEWVPGQGTQDRPTRWGPKYPIPGQSQPNVSWDPEHGHWDHDDGNRNRTRWLPGGGGQVDHNNNPVTMMDRMRSITPGPILKWGTAGVVIYIIIDEGSRLYPPRNLVPVP